MDTSADRDALLDRLGAELADVGCRVERIRLDLGALRTAPDRAPESGTTVTGASTGAAPRGTPTGTPTGVPPTPAADRTGIGPWSPGAPPPAGPAGLWSPPGPPPSGPHPSWPGAAFPPPGPPAPSPAKPRSRAGLGARLLAVTGGAVTLLGVVLLLVLAARSGWFSPGARLIAGAVVGLGLVGAGLRVRARSTDGTDTGAVALAATGIAALYLDVAAACALYAFLPVPVALAAALVVLAGGLALADRWRREGLAVGVLVGGTVLAPVVAGGPTPLVVALLVVAQLAAAPVALRRAWPTTAVVATVAAALIGATAVLRAAVSGTEESTTAAATAAVAVVGVALAIAAAGRFSARTTGTVLLASLPPVLLAATALGRGPGATVAGVTALGLLVAAAVPRIRAAGLAQVALAAAAVAGFEATTLALRGTTLTAVLLGQAVLLAVLAVRADAPAATGTSDSSADRSGLRDVLLVGHGRGPLIAAAAYGLVGLGFALGRDLPLDALTAFGGGRLTPRIAGTVVRDVPALVGAVAVAVLLVALAGALLLAVTRLGVLHCREDAPFLVAGLGLLGLYGAAGLVVTLALLVSPTRAGFLTGHVLVTVSWTALALLLLVRGIRDSTPRLLGGVLVVAAVLKLVFFDLTALDGIARVAAFLGAGLVLLVAGTRYARLVAEADEADDTDGDDDPDTASTTDAGSSRVGPADSEGRRPPA